VAMIALIPERITRSVYVKECSRLMKMEEVTLWSELRSLRGKVVAENNQQAYEQRTEMLKANAPARYDVLSSEPQEREVVKVLIKYGNEEGVFLGEPEDGEEPAKFSMKIADYIIQSMKEDDFVFESEACRKIYNEYCDLYEHGEPVTEEYFVRHSDPTINKLAMELTVEAHELSPNWQIIRHVAVKTEKDHLGLTSEKAIYALKSRRVEIMIKELQESIKGPLSETELSQMIEHKRKLDEAKRLFKMKLTRVI